MLIAVVGGGGFAREVQPMVAETAGAKVVFVDTRLKESGDVGGIPALTTLDFLNHPDKLKTFVVALSDWQTRKQIAEQLEVAGIDAGTAISRHSVIYDRNTIGTGTIICAGSIVTTDAKIGRHVHLNLQTYVAHDCVVEDYVTFAPRVACNGSVTIGEGAYIGTGAVIRQGLTIGRGAVVGMGAVVTKNVPDGETWVGNPARKMEKRS